MSDYAGFEYDQDVSGDQEVVIAMFAGKTIEKLERADGLAFGGNAIYVFHFTDGTQATLASWDYEGYSSGIYVFPGVPTRDAR